METTRLIGSRIVLFAIFVLTASGAAAQAPVRSFADLQPTLRLGQRVIVKDDDGRATRGRFASLAGDRLEIRRARWFFREERLTFREESVWVVENDDSDWNGTLIGFGLGIGVMALAVESCTSDECVGFVLAPVFGAVVGGMIDKAHNRPLYLSPRATSIAVSPLLAPRQVGLAATLRF